MGFFKEEDWEKPAMEMIDTLDQKTKDLTLGIFESIMGDYISVLDDAESPIERLFGVAFMYATRFIYDIDIFQQEEITCFDKKYRVDFLVVIGLSKDRKGKLYNFVIECDGHDFHEKTKLQAKRDKQRDRHLTASGYHVIRFTGSEIWADPRKCAKETRDMILNISSRSK